MGITNGEGATSTTAADALSGLVDKTNGEESGHNSRQIPVSSAVFTKGNDVVEMVQTKVGKFSPTP